MLRIFRFAACAALLAGAVCLPATAAEVPYDVIIANGRIVDGTGSPWYYGDVGIRGGRIAAIGKLGDAPAAKRIDAAGKVVAPGFIDMLGQSELTILVDPRLPSKIYQGITTEVTGEGNSPAPLIGRARDEMAQALEHYGLTADWRTFGEYFARLERQGIGINLASYVGATSIREAVIGLDDRPPSAAELVRMRSLVREAMEQGAVGVSSSLEYAPAPYASTEELIALASEAAPYGGIYATHMRSEGDAITAALDETFRIAREAHIPAEIWHLKVAGKRNFGRMAEVIKRIEAARAGGLDISADTYAYTAWFNDMSAFVPPWAHDGGNDRMIARLKDPATRARIIKDIKTPSTKWDNEWDEVQGPESILVGVVKNPALLPLQGKTIAAVAKERGKDPLETLLDILVEDNGFTGCAVFGMQEADVALALAQPWVAVNNDSSGTSPEGVLGKEHPHPRAYGTFPRILRKYVREEHRLSLEDAVRKFAALPAQRMRFTDRGVLKQGLFADVVVFDPATITDRSTFSEPNQLATGMSWVLVNGVPVIADGRMTGAKPGHVLRGPGYRGPG
ncbi:MAG TPA: D-aminoacylase [Steroidobacteraceae bacterium]|jgi:dihydroorotase/N-acyl-D-amino-acid deacylase|nr:D-aminoacylase [Steroidobacteraceae bacterium]